MSLSCIECSCRIEASDAYYNNAAARAFIPFAGRLMSDGPFCSERCKRDYVTAAENKSQAKAAKKAGVSSYSSGMDSSNVKEQRRVLELQKEEREAAESQQRREKEEEENQQRKAQAAQYRAQGLPTLAFFVGNSPTLWAVGVAYLFATFFAALMLGPHKGKMAVWVWVVSGILLLVAAGLVGRRMYQENTARKAV